MIHTKYHLTNDKTVLHEPIMVTPHQCFHLATCGDSALLSSDADVSLLESVLLDGEDVSVGDRGGDISFFCVILPAAAAWF